MTPPRARELLLGLDVGTTSCKAAVLTPDGEELAHGRAATPWRLVPTGAEADPVALLGAAVEAAEAALAGVPDGHVAGVGVASMGEAGVLLDRDGTPLGPLIAWHDARGAEESEALARDLGRDRFAERTGLPPHPMYSAVKHRWLREHEPEIVERAVRRLNVAEWIVRGLGGDELTEWSLASRTGWLDLHARGWWDEALAWSGAPASLLPEIALAGTPAGTAGERLARARGAVLAIAGHDHLSAAVGAGAVGAGDVLDSCGTAETLIRATAPLPPARVRAAVEQGINVGWHAVPGVMCLLGSIRSGAGLEHVMSLLGVAPGGAAGARGGRARGPGRGRRDRRLRDRRRAVRDHGRRAGRHPGTGVARGARGGGGGGRGRARDHGRPCRPPRAARRGGRLGRRRRRARRQGRAPGGVHDGRLGVRGRARRGAHRGAGGGAGRAARVSGHPAARFGAFAAVAEGRRRPRRTSTAALREGPVGGGGPARTS